MKKIEHSFLETIFCDLMVVKDQFIIHMEDKGELLLTDCTITTHNNTEHFIRI